MRADELKQESSQSASVSADLYHTFGNVQTNLLIEGFYTSLKDVFALRRIGTDINGNEVLERYNGSGAIVKGVNIEGKAALSNKIQIQAGITMQQSKYKEPEQWSEDPEVPAVKKMFRSPNTYGYFTATYNPFKNFSSSLTGTYTGKMIVQHFAGSGVDIDTAVTTPRFFDMNLKLSYDFTLFNSLTLQVNGGIMNIFNSYQKDFDKGSERDSGYVYGPALPRSLYFGVKIKI